MALVGALGLPTSAQTDVNARAWAAAKAGACANLDLARAARRVGRPGCVTRTFALHNRSGRTLELAVTATRTVAAAADSSHEVRVGARAVTGVSSALRRDARLQATIAIAAAGRLERQAASALVADARMQQAIIASSLQMAAYAPEGLQHVALHSSRRAVPQLSAQVHAGEDEAAG